MRPRTLAARLRHALAVLALGCAATGAHAGLSIFACEPEWGALAQRLAGRDAEIFVATTALQDPHRIEARPSLIARLRRADLLACTGAELEIGWLPALIEQAGNPRVLPGRPGHFLAAAQVTLKEKPQRLDRALGDIHAEGNPHVHQDPRNLLPVARALSARLQAIDAGNAAAYAEALTHFETDWQAGLQRWRATAAPLAGMPVAIQHQAPYLVDWLGLRVVAVLEAVPGVEPSAAHLARVAAQLAETPARLILRDAYHNPRPAEWLSRRTGVPVAVLPSTVGGAPDAGDLAALYEATIARLLAGLGSGASR
jgi:zinc/manganese transport system substrate-binding protein